MLRKYCCWIIRRVPVRHHANQQHQPQQHKRNSLHIFFRIKHPSIMSSSNPTSSVTTTNNQQQQQQQPSSNSSSSLPLEGGGGRGGGRGSGRIVIDDGNRSATTSVSNNRGRVGGSRSAGNTTNSSGRGRGRGRGNNNNDNSTTSSNRCGSGDNHNNNSGGRNTNNRDNITNHSDSNTKSTGNRSSNNNTGSSNRGRGGGGGGGGAGRSGGRNSGGRGRGNNNTTTSATTTTSSNTNQGTTDTANTNPTSGPPPAETSTTTSGTNSKTKSSTNRGRRGATNNKQSKDSKGSSNEDAATKAKVKEENERKRLEEIQIAKEKAEQEEKEKQLEIQRQEMERKQREIQKLEQEKREERERLLQQRTDSIKEAMRIIQSTLDIALIHITSRNQYQNVETLKQIRTDFELRKKTIKVDLKKCTTFIKKIKMGTYWNNISSSTSSSITTGAGSSSINQPSLQSVKNMIDTITNDVASLNLSRYVEEVVAAILESCSIPNISTTPSSSTVNSPGVNTGNTNATKIGSSELLIIVALIQAMHARYPDFLSNLLPPLWNALLHTDAHNSNKHHRRLYVRLLTELMLHGLLSNHDIQKFMKCIIDWTGGSNQTTSTNDTVQQQQQQYIVQDAIALVAFIRTAGFEVLGIVPTSLQKAIDTIRNEQNLHLQHPAIEDTNMDDTEQQEVSDVITTSVEGDTVLLNPKLIDSAIKIADQMEPIMTNQRALPIETIDLLIKHCIASYQAMSATYVQTYHKMKKLEKRYEQDRLIIGQLTAQREKGYVDAQKLCDTLQKSVEVLSDCLHVPMPILINDDDENRMANSGHAGIEVWTKENESNPNENFGPFDDEETRSFYCDIPDLLATIPPALLGLSDEQVEKQKQSNLKKYSSTMFDDNNANNTNSTPTSNENDIIAAEQLDGTENEPLIDDDDVDQSKQDGEKGENTDTPHYRLMSLLEQELPECNRREQVDEIAEKFATNHGSSKNSRKRLLKALFLVPRSRLDLIPFYCRLVTTLDHVYADLATALVTSLVQQFHGQAKYKKNQNIESRMRTARYISELTKFRCAPPIFILNCLAVCIEDFTGHNVEIACCILESCGRFLYRTKHTNPRIIAVMETMTRLSKAKNLDERLQSLLKAAFYNVKPPPLGPRKKVKEYPPLEAYLRHLLLVRLEATEPIISMVSKQLVRLPWHDPSYDCAALVCKLMLKACRKGRYKTIEAVAAVAAKLRTQRAAGEVPIRLTDAVLEELRWALEQPNFRDQQRIVTYTRLLGELHVSGQVSGSIIIDQLYDFINYGHLIPEQLREASKELYSKPVIVEPETKLPEYNSAGTVSQVIKEDEEMEDSELVTNVIESDEAPKPVAVAPYSIYDPRVPSVKDSTTSTYRITLICTLLETSARALITRSNIPRLRGFFAAFQRYLFTKMVLPTDVEFSLLDTFDIVDSHWKRVVTTSSRGVKNTSKDVGFPRYTNWLEAHNATLVVEEAESTLQAQKRARLEALADESKSLTEISASSNEEDPDENLLFGNEDESDSSGEDDEDESVSVKSKDSAGVDIVPEEDTMDIENEARYEEAGQSVDSDDGDEEADNDVEVDGENDEDSEGESDDDEEEDYEDEDDEEEVEEEFDEEAYMLQLEEEAFERELRLLTMEAIEKGKTVSRKQVDDSMISGSQIMKRKPTATTDKVVMRSTYMNEPVVPVAANTGVALGGGAGVSFQMIKKGNKGKIELKELVVPVDTNLVMAATRHDDAAARERDEIKQRVLRYEIQSETSGGNVYLEQGRLERNRNRPLSMDEIDKNFGTTGGNLHPSQIDKKAPTATTISSGRGGGRGVSSNHPGRTGGRGGRTNTGGRHLF